MRHLGRLLIVAGVLVLGRTSMALDPTLAGGVGGKGGAAHVTAGWGRASDDGLAHPGFPTHVGAGMIGVTPGGVTSSTNRASDDGFHAAGLGKAITAGIGRSTMETVPGRSPTYINIVAGKRAEPLMGARGP